MKKVKSTRQSTIEAAAGCQYRIAGQYCVHAEQYGCTGCRLNTRRSILSGVSTADITAADITAARNDIRESGNTAAGTLRNAEECLRNDKGRSNRIAVIAARIEAKKY